MATCERLTLNNDGSVKIKWTPIAPMSSVNDGIHLMAFKGKLTLRWSTMTSNYPVEQYDSIKNIWTKYASSANQPNPEKTTSTLIEDSQPLQWLAINSNYLDHLVLLLEWNKKSKCEEKNLILYLQYFRAHDNLLLFSIPRTMNLHNLVSLTFLLCLLYAFIQTGHYSTCINSYISPCFLSTLAPLTTKLSENLTTYWTFSLFIPISILQTYDQNDSHSINANATLPFHHGLSEFIPY